MSPEEDDSRRRVFLRRGERAVLSRCVPRDGSVEREAGHSLFDARGWGRSREVEQSRGGDDPASGDGHRGQEEEAGERRYGVSHRHSTTTVSFMLPCCAPQKWWQIAVKRPIFSGVTVSSCV